MRKRLPVAFLGTLLVASLLVGCAPGRSGRAPAPKATTVPPPVTTASPTPSPASEVDLPFETIERRDTPGTGRNYERKEPKLVIIAEEVEIDALGGTISPKAVAELHNLDFSKFFVASVFQGLKITNQYGAEIRRVTQRGNTIIVHAHFTERDPRRVAADVMTSPYHVVKVQKAENLRGKLEFVLQVDGKELIRQTYVLR